MNLKVTVAEGGLLPPWHYGVAYYDHNLCAAVFYPIPINYLVRSARLCSMLWDRLRCGRGCMDEQILACAKKDRVWGIQRYDYRLGVHIWGKIDLRIPDKKTRDEIKLIFISAVLDTHKEFGIEP